MQTQRMVLSCKTLKLWKLSNDVKIFSEKMWCANWSSYVLVGDLVGGWFLLLGDLGSGQFGSWAIFHWVISPIGRFFLLGDFTCAPIHHAGAQKEEGCRSGYIRRELQVRKYLTWWYPYLCFLSTWEVEIAHFYTTKSYK